MSTFSPAVADSRSPPLFLNMSAKVPRFSTPSPVTFLDICRRFLALYITVSDRDSIPECSQIQPHGEDVP